VRGRLRAGARTEGLTGVRNHLAAATGGRLARAARGGRIGVLAISDVVGDRLDVIASGPFAPDPTCYADALAVLGRRDPGRRIPANVRAHLEAGAPRGGEGDPRGGGPAGARARPPPVARPPTPRS